MKTGSGKLTVTHEFDLSQPCQRCQKASDAYSQYRRKAAPEPEYKVLIRYETDDYDRKIERKYTICECGGTGYSCRRTVEEKRGWF